jgi:hypothetical protein
MTLLIFDINYLYELLYIIKRAVGVIPDEKLNNCV